MKKFIKSFGKSKKQPPADAQKPQLKSVASSGAASVSVRSEPLHAYKLPAPEQQTVPAVPARPPQLPPQQPQHQQIQQQQQQHYATPPLERAPLARPPAQDAPPSVTRLTEDNVAAISPTSPQVQPKPHPPQPTPPAPANPTASHRAPCPSNDGVLTTHRCPRSGPAAGTRSPADGRSSRGRPAQPPARQGTFGCLAARPEPTRRRAPAAPPACRRSADRRGRRRLAVSSALTCEADWLPTEPLSASAPAIERSRATCLQSLLGTAAQDASVWRHRPVLISLHRAAHIACQPRVSWRRIWTHTIPLSRLLQAPATQPGAHAAQPPRSLSGVLVVAVADLRTAPAAATAHHPRRRGGRAPGVGDGQCQGVRADAAHQPA